MNVAAAPLVRSAPVETEDDGQPGQIPPSQRVRDLPDDPTEPWSRNYGAQRAASSGEAGHAAPVRAAAIADDLPAEFRQRLAEALDP